MNPSNLIDNYYGSTFSYAGIERLLVPTRNNKITNVLANNFPAYDQVIMLVNSTKYGGSGGWVATASVNASSKEIVLHELGHSFSNLADEYWAGEQYAHEAINMTKETDLTKLRWRNWYGDFGIGLYPFSASPVWYRPHQNCKMRVLGLPYCSVCTEGINDSIHSLVSPVRSYSPADTNISSTLLPLVFSLDLIRPHPNTLKRIWKLNGLSVNRDVDSLIIDSNNLISGPNTLAVTIKDTTQLLRVDNHYTIHLSTITWMIENSVTGIGNIRSFSNKILMRLYPTPSKEFLNIIIQGEITGDVRVDIYDLQGRVMKSELLQNSQMNTLGLSSLHQGIYILKFYLDNEYITSGKIIKTE